MSGSRILITPTFRMSFPNLTKPRAVQQQGRERGEPRYSVEMLFDAADLEKFKVFDEQKQEFVDVDFRVIAAKCAKEVWPDMNIKEAVSQDVLGWPVRDGDAVADKRDAAGKKNSDHYRGKKIISAKANQEFPPRLYHTKNGKREQIVRGTDSGDQLATQLFYGGAYAFAEITVKALPTPQGKYVTCYLNSIKFSKDGERFGGGNLMDRFDGVSGGEADVDPTAGGKDLDDEIPF